MERMERQFAFALEADKEKNIIRHTLVSDGSRRENDAEHASAHRHDAADT